MIESWKNAKTEYRKRTYKCTARMGVISCKLQGEQRVVCCVVLITFMAHLPELTCSPTFLFILFPPPSTFPFLLVAHQIWLPEYSLRGNNGLFFKIFNRKSILGIFSKSTNKRVDNVIILRYFILLYIYIICGLIR